MSTDPSTRAPGPAVDAPLAARAAYLLSMIGRSQANRLSNRLRPLGLRPKHFALLNLVAAEEGRSQQQLGERLALEPSGIVGTIDELEQQGFIDRRRDPNDRRRHAVYLTAAGHEKLSEARQAATERGAELLAPLDDEELRAFHDMLTRIAAAEDIRAPGDPGS
jgi:DNA-binding MarR family transcriptional regulator